MRAGAADTADEWIPGSLGNPTASTSLGRHPRDLPFADLVGSREGIAPQPAAATFSPLRHSHLFAGLVRRILPDEWIPWIHREPNRLNLPRSSILEICRLQTWWVREKRLKKKREIIEAHTSCGLVRRILLMNGSRDPSGTQPPQPPSVVILEICRLQTWWVRGKGLPLNRLPPPSPRRRGEGICRARSLP